MSKLPQIDLYPKIIFNSFNKKNNPTCLVVPHLWNTLTPTSLCYFSWTQFALSMLMYRSQAIIATNTLLIPYIFI
ncbi:Uncharacterized protein cmbei_5003440 [Cryptosporidium meleagridis]